MTDAKHSHVAPEVARPADAPTARLMDLVQGGG
jgi:hypothetical protein